MFFGLSIFQQTLQLGGTPLYTPIRYAKKNDEITDQLFEKRLGHMGWKSVDDVIFLDEQQW